MKYIIGVIVFIILIPITYIQAIAFFIVWGICNHDLFGEHPPISFEIYRKIVK